MNGKVLLMMIWYIYQGDKRLREKCLFGFPRLIYPAAFFSQKVIPILGLLLHTSECAFGTGGEATGLEEKGRNDQKYNYIELIVYFAKSVGCGSPKFTAVSYIGVSARKAIDTGEHACSCIL